MSIWNYGDIARPFEMGFTAFVMERRTCLYCKSMLQSVADIPSTAHDHTEVTGRCCPVCGWWYVQEVLEMSHDHYFGGFARLRNLDISDISMSLDEVRSYLVAKFESRFEVDPRIFEHTVASIFRDLGYAARVTSYSKDNGIDVYLDGPGDCLVGVQVKRWRGKIKVEQIHSLAGALIVNGCTEGVFVTTSEFQSGARRNADIFKSEAGIPIELIDASRLYEALKIATRVGIPSGSSPTAPWNAVKREKMWID